MEPERKPRAREKMLSVADWDSPEHAVRSIRRAMIASWVVLPLLVAAYAIFRSSASRDMRDLLQLLFLSSILLARWLLRRNVPERTDMVEPNVWMVVLGFVPAVGLLAGAIANNRWMMVTAAWGLGVVFLYIFARAIADEVHIFRNPLKHLVSNEEAAGTRSPDVTAPRF